MSAILLDTSAYLAMAEGHKQILAEMANADLIAMSAIVLGELEIGFERAGNVNQDERDLRQFLESPRVQLADVTQHTARPYAMIYNSLRSIGQPISANDLWIAASAMEHSLELVTCDRHFERIPQIIVRCYDSAKMD